MSESRLSSLALEHILKLVPLDLDDQFICRSQTFEICSVVRLCVEVVIIDVRGISLAKMQGPFGVY